MDCYDRGAMLQYGADQLRHRINNQWVMQVISCGNVLVADSNLVVAQTKRYIASR